MATRSEIEAYQSTIDGLTTVAFAQVKQLLLSLADPNPIEFRDALLLAYPELMQPFMGAASEVAGEWYMTLRGSAGITSAFTPVLAPAAPDEQLRSGVRYSLSPLFQPQRFIGSDVLTMLAGFSQKMIANAGRDTIASSAVAETRKTYWQRVPRAGCCAFCALVASRGAVYRSADSAGGSYHDFCRCVAAPKFPDGDNDYLDYVEKTFSDQYGNVAAENGSNSRDLKTTLANWRQEYGVK